MSDEAARYVEFFKEADANGDGSLTLKELIAAMRKHGYPGSDEEIATFFNAVDMTGDKKIELDEYMIVMGKMPPNYHKSAILRQVFNEFDKDGSGEVDKKELQAIFKECGSKLSKAEINKIMDSADTDGSGTMNFDEFVKALFD